MDSPKSTAKLLFTVKGDGDSRKIFETNPILASDSDDDFVPKKLSFHSEDSSRNESKSFHDVNEKYDGLVKDGEEDRRTFETNTIWASSSDEDEHELSNDFLPKKLSFHSEDSIRNESKGTSFHDVEERYKGLETHILEEYESCSGEEEGLAKSFLGKHQVTLINSSSEDSEVRESKQKAKLRKRIILLESSSDSSDDENASNSFDLGAIKKKYTTPGPLKDKKQAQIEENSESENDYDLQDSFINDDSECDASLNDVSEEELSDESWSEDPSDHDSDISDVLETPEKTSPVKKKTENDKEISTTPKRFIPKGKGRVTSTVTKPTMITTKTLLASLDDTEIMPDTHPSAKIYITHFSRNKVELSDFLFKLFNSEVFDGCLPYSTKIIWSNTLLKTAGRCRLKEDRKNHEKFCEIELATKVLTSADRVRDTLIHEMCHAASWIISGCNGGHGVVFKSWGKRAVKVFSELPLITRCHNYKIEAKFAYICVDCNTKFMRHSKSVNTDAKICGKCAKEKIKGKGKLTLHIFNKRTKAYEPYLTNERQAASSVKKPNAFALFVKENYKHCRMPGISHNDAMKELSKMFASTKLTGN